MRKYLLSVIALLCFIFCVSCKTEKAGNTKPFMSKREFAGKWEFSSYKKKTPIYLMNASGWKMDILFSDNGTVYFLQPNKRIENTKYTWHIEGNYLILNTKTGKPFFNLNNKLKFVKKEQNCLIFEPIYTGTVKIKAKYKACKMK